MTDDGSVELSQGAVNGFLGGSVRCLLHTKASHTAATQPEPPLWLMPLRPSAGCIDAFGRAPAQM